MSLTTSLAIYFIVWWVVLFLVLPWGIRSQAESGDIGLSLEPGARRALIGPNGAGKTTLVNLITGALRPSAGTVLLDGEDITHLSQAARARRGIARTFQINQLFRGLTVLENLCLVI